MYQKKMMRHTLRYIQKNGPSGFKNNVFVYSEISYWSKNPFFLPWGKSVETLSFN